MKKKIHAVVAILMALLLLIMAPVAAAQAPAVKAGVLTNATGMTLYTFDNDPVASGNSMCVGTCAKNWPPLAAGSSDKAQGDYTIIGRDDGTRQWAYKGKPLYLWTQDKKPGDQSGDGVNKLWHVARP